METVWNRLIARHDMLRAVVRDGQQQVLEQTPRWVIPAHILHTPEEALQVREKLAHQVLNPEVWPVFDLQVGYVDGMPARLWLCLDNLLLDGLSMQILLAELEHGYRYPQQLLPPLPVTFRDYLQQPSLQSPNPDSLAWWQAQLDDIPPAPALPLRCLPQEVETPRFARLNGALDSTRWHRLKNGRLTPISPRRPYCCRCGQRFSLHGVHSLSSRLTLRFSTGDRCTRKSTRFWAISPR